MRGELDDALNRMARMEELNRRRARERAGQPSGDRSGIDEVIEAVRRVVAQHPRLRVALWAEEGTAGAGVRVEWLNGELIVLPDEEPPPPTTGPSPEPGLSTSTPEPPLSSMPSAPAEPEMMPPAQQRPDPAVVVPEAWRPPPPVPVSLPTQSPASWSPDEDDDMSESAARLAELVRQDPSLLRAPRDPYSRG